MNTNEIYDNVVSEHPQLLNKLEEAIMRAEAIRIRENVITNLSSVMNVIEYVCKTRGITMAALEGASRKRSIVEARQMIWWLIKNRVIHNNTTLEAMGELFNKDHSTVHHGIKNINEILQVDGDIRDYLMIAANHFKTYAEWNPHMKTLTLSSTVLEEY